MGKVRLQKGSEEFEMFQDYWNMYQEHLAVERTDSYWEKAAEDSRLFYEKHNTPFARELAVAYMNELERRGKDGI